jgi:hypothetical protein
VHYCSDTIREGGGGLEELSVKKPALVRCLNWSLALNLGVSLLLCGGLSPSDFYCSG